MLTIRQLVPPSVTHLARPLLLVDGSTVILAAVASSLYVRIPIWKTDMYGKEECNLGHTVDELNLGSVAVEIVPCAHQCFVVLTEDNEVVVGRYQANLPTPHDSWLENDVLHPNNSWIILHRGKLSTSRLGSRPAPSMCPLFACGLSGTVVQCSIFRGWRHAIRIVIPSNASDTFLREKWVIDVPHGVGSFSYSVAPFKRDVIEESDEDLLMRCTVAELAERKRTQCPPMVTLPCGSPPVRVTIDVGTADDTVVAMALMPGLHYSRHDSFVFVSTYRGSLKVYEVQPSSHLKDLAASICVDGSPYFVLTLPDRMLVLSVLGGIHILSVLLLDGNTPIGMAAHTQSWGVIRLARSSHKVVAGVVLQTKDPPPHNSTKEVLWLLLDNGTLTEVPLNAWLSQDGQTVLCDAPGIHSGDCEDGEWPESCIDGVACGFRAVSLLPLQQQRRSCWAPYAGTGRYALLGDGIADTYIIDLITRRVVGGLCSHGAMTAACTGPGVSLLVGYSKGVLECLSPGLAAAARVCAEFAGIRQMHPLTHMPFTTSAGLVFYWLVTTATHTVVLEGAVGYIKRVRETRDFILDEPTLAFYSASLSSSASSVIEVGVPPSSLSFAQCTPTRLNLSGRRILLRQLLPEFESISHACFGGNSFITVAESRRLSVLWIDNEDLPRVLVQESLPGDISHLTTWPIDEKKQQWGIAACLWSHEIVVLLLNKSVVHRHVLPISAVVLSSFSLGNNTKCDTIHNGDSNNNNNNNNNNIKSHKTTEDVCKRSGVGLTLVDHTTAVLHCDSVEHQPTLNILEDVDGDGFSADDCFSVFALGGKTNPSPHFNLMALRDNTVELVVLDSTAVIMEQLGVALSPHSGMLGSDHSGIITNTTTGDVDPAFRCGFVLYIPSVSYYIIVLANATHLAVWSLPEVIPPTGKTASPSQRRSVLRRGPVAYQVTRSLQLPSVTTYEHRLSRIVYLPFSSTIVALTDRGETTSLVSTIDAETFRILDGLPMATREIPTCIEPLCTDTNTTTTITNSASATDAVVIGTAVQPFATTSEPSEGRLLVLHVRPLRISAMASIRTGGVIDISVQGFGEEQLIAVAAFDRVLVYRLTGVTLTHLCSTDTKSACTTVALRYPFISCGLQLWGTQYMQLLPEGGKTGDPDPDDWESLSTASVDDEYDHSPNIGITTSHPNTSEGERESSLEQQSCGGVGAPWSRWRGVAFTLKSCVLEPAAFASVHTQTIYGDDFVRVDAARNLTMISFRAPAAPVADEVAATRVVGVEGGYCSALTRAVRLPSCPLHLFVCGRSRWSPWRHRRVPFVLCGEHPAALRRVGPLLLLPCADGGLRLAGEIPHAFAGPLLRVEQRITELHDTTLALSRQWESTIVIRDIHTNTADVHKGGGGGMRRTCHAVSVESAHAIQSATRVLRKQNFLCVDAVEEYWLLTLLAEVPDPMLEPDEAIMIARKKGLLDKHLLHVWEEYAGTLQDVDIGEVLYLW